MQTTSATRRWSAFAVLLVGAFLPPLDFFIVNVALPSIQSSLHTSVAELQLVISGYASAYAVFLITGGRLGDLFRRRNLPMWHQLLRTDSVMFSAFSWSSPFICNRQSG